MNREIPVHNPGRNVMYVAGCAVQPGETRILPADLVPAHVRNPKPAAADEPPVAADDDIDLRDFLGGTVAEVRAGLAGLADDVLPLLAGLEDKTSGGAGRKGVLEAIAEEQLRRASKAHLDEFKASLDGLNEDALLNLLDEVHQDLDKAELVQAALDALNPGTGTDD